MHLRQVFRFELDSEDLEQLQDVFGFATTSGTVPNGDPITSGSASGSSSSMLDNMSPDAWEELEEDFQQVLLAELQEQQRQGKYW